MTKGHHQIFWMKNSKPPLICHPISQCLDCRPTMFVIYSDPSRTFVTARFSSIKPLEMWGKKKVNKRTKKNQIEDNGGQVAANKTIVDRGRH